MPQPTTLLDRAAVVALVLLVAVLGVLVCTEARADVCSGSLSVIPGVVGNGDPLLLEPGDELTLQLCVQHASETNPVDGQGLVAGILPQGQIALLRSDCFDPTCQATVDVFDFVACDGIQGVTCAENVAGVGFTFTEDIPLGPGEFLCLGTVTVVATDTPPAGTVSIQGQAPVETQDPLCTPQEQGSGVGTTTVVFAPPRAPETVLAAECLANGGPIVAEVANTGDGAATDCLLSIVWDPDGEALELGPFGPFDVAPGARTSPAGQVTPPPHVASTAVLVGLACAEADTTVVVPVDCPGRFTPTCDPTVEVCECPMVMPAFPGASDLLR